MSLHDEIQIHINELQNLLQETNEETLLDKAREQWGEDDSRYEVLEQFVKSPSSSKSKFNKQAKPMGSEPKPSQTEENKPVE